MAKGGARARSGPPPDPNALKRERDGDQWTELPPEGRPGNPPRWPLTKQSAREKTLWKREWSRPQAIEWERNGQELEVAIYVRTAIEAGHLAASTATRTLLRQQQEALGISLPGLARNRWTIGKPAAAKQRPQHAGRQRSAAKSRFKVHDGGRAA